ncbi:TAXI family TRAP transporter solute-binding subunit [Thioclava sp. BHET1]|nr:TAXI family TRAP transporter solute-binding subunit [Thioclava sp. BHET1]
MFRAITTVARIGGTAAAAALAFAAAAHAEDRIAYKSAKSGTSYYQMGVELANAVKAGSEGKTILTIEESQGSVQNVMEAKARPGNYVFTAPPGLVKAAKAGTGPFKGRPSSAFVKIRALFPIPSLTMHIVLRRADDGKSVEPVSALAGKSILLGRGTFGATEGAKYLALFGLEGKVKIANAELGNAADALKNGQIDGFVTAGSFPAPNVIEASASTPVALVSLSDEEIAKTGRTRQEIPAGTYAGVDQPVATTSLDVEAFTTTDMSDETAYQLTKTFWTEKAKMATNSPWWRAVTPAMLMQTGVKLHPGAIRYYKEAGITIPADMQ